jgi:hypothetical protein
MGYYMRFFDTSDQALNLRDVDSALRQVDPAYRVEIISETNDLQGELHYADDLYGEIEVNLPGDGLFAAEIQEQLEGVEEAEGDSVLVAAILRAANCSVGCSRTVARSRVGGYSSSD